MAEDIIRLENLVKIYDTGALRVLGLDKINLSIKKGEFVSIMGHSGSGKSTLMNILGCLDRPTLGKYYLDGIGVDEMESNELSRVRNQKIGFVFQSFNARMKPSERRKRAIELLTKVGLKERLWHQPNELSGGQRQRVAIARALANDPPLILADEPTGNLDSRASIEIMELFAGLHREGATVVVVTHEENIAAYTHRIITFSDGRIISDRINENPTPVSEDSDLSERIS